MTTFLGVPIGCGARCTGTSTSPTSATERRSTSSTRSSPSRSRTQPVSPSTTHGCMPACRRHGPVRDRERIARDLHDLVIQRLFATGLTLQGVAQLAGDDPLRDRVETSIDDLDTTVREIRSTIFQLHSGRTGDRSLRRAALELAAESARTLGFDPTVRLEGPVDTVSDGAISDHLLAAQREALANVARHASARSVEVAIRARRRAHAGGPRRRSRHQRPPHRRRERPREPPFTRTSARWYLHGRAVRGGRDPAHLDGADRQLNPVRADRDQRPCSDPGRISTMDAMGNATDRPTAAGSAPSTRDVMVLESHPASHAVWSRV